MLGVCHTTEEDKKYEWNHKIMQGGKKLKQQVFEDAAPHKPRPVPGCLVGEASRKEFPGTGASQPLPPPH